MSTHRNHGHPPERCPFLDAFALLAAVSGAGPAVLMLASWDVSPSTIFIVQLTGIAAFALGLESRRLRGSDCPLLELSASRRLAVYALVWIVASLMLFPIGAIAGAPLPALAALIALVVLPVAAMLKVHVIVDHGDLEVAGVRWWWVVASRLPLYLMIGLGALLAVGGGVEAIRALVPRLRT